MPIENVRWSLKDLEPYAIPAEARRFLSEEGLPQEIPGTTVEFCVCDSENALVIGIDYEFPIEVHEDGSVWEMDSPEGDVFINSSVRQLAQSVTLYLEVIQREDDIPEDGSDLLELRRQLKEVDEVAMIEDGHHFWPGLVEMLEVM
jgi:hypothetical protein